MRGLALNFASTHQAENPLGFSEVGENKQLLIAIVASSFFVQYVDSNHIRPLDKKLVASSPRGCFNP
ncbi:hypothetical protein BWZ20_00510 [Winogradskyella sp. J14-2]|nr:hypothetical protein BWZ20_00510 [Winogradskyella sp. J14-2]